jgi:RsiW-degrading membrane proteinase PrsW (M82 family)
MVDRVSAVTIKLGLGPVSFRFVWFLGYLLVFGIIVLLLFPKTVPALIFPLYFLLGMLVLTVCNRTVPLGWVVLFFVYGATIVPFVALVLAWPINLILGTDSAFRSNVLIPALEETLKVVPLLVYLTLKSWRYRWTAGAADLMILGAAVGGGFAFFEDVLLGFITGGVAGMTSGEFILATHQATPHLGPIYLFPSMDVGYSNSAYIGHTAATAFVGLTLGLTRLLSGRLGKLAWILPLWAWFWVVFDHGIFNHIAGRGSLSGFMNFLYTLDARGRLSTIVFYLLLLATLVYERRILGHYQDRTKVYALDRDNLRLFKGQLNGAVEYVSQVLLLRIYIRERRGLTYGLHFHHSPGRDTGEKGQQRLNHLKRVSATLAMWKGKVEITPSLQWAEVLANLPA